MVVAMFIPAHMARISQTALSQPLISGGLGILTVIIVPIILVLLAITICLIPVSLLGAFLLVLAWAFGLIALGLEVGKADQRHVQAGMASCHCSRVGHLVIDDRV